MLTVGSHTLPLGRRTLVMGILNMTPDSFSDGGKYNTLDRALMQAEKLKIDGVDIIDVGGESTRPGASYVSVEEELERVIPIIEQLSTRIDLPVSIDTYKAKVAEEAIQAGAHIINDVWGAKRDVDMPRVMAQSQVPVILMHNRNQSRYQHLLEDIKQDLLESIELVREAGVLEDNIILDPGIGFAKTSEENVVVMQHLDEIVGLGYPVLLGTSRKSFIGKVLDLPPEQRVEGTLATIGFGVMKGCHIVRVHDVRETVRYCRMLDVLKGATGDHG